MSTFYAAWILNSSQGEITTAIIGSLGLALVSGWMLIDLAISARYQHIARWMYVLAVGLLAALVVIWF